MSGQIKTCGCGHSFNWFATPLKGVQECPADYTECDCFTLPDGSHTPDCAGNGIKLELKNCPKCDTTLAERK